MKGSLYQSLFDSFYAELVNCGVNATKTLNHTCSYGQINAALYEQREMVVEKFSDTTISFPFIIDLEVCQCKYIQQLSE